MYYWKKTHKKEQEKQANRYKGFTVYMKWCYITLR